MLLIKWSEELDELHTDTEVAELKEVFESFKFEAEVSVQSAPDLVLLGVTSRNAFLHVISLKSVRLREQYEMPRNVRYLWPLF